METRSGFDRLKAALATRLHGVPSPKNPAQRPFGKALLDLVADYSTSNGQLDLARIRRDFGDSLEFLLLSMEGLAAIRPLNPTWFEGKGPLYLDGFDDSDEGASVGPSPPVSTSNAGALGYDIREIDGPASASFLRNSALEGEALPPQAALLRLLQTLNARDVRSLIVENHVRLPDAVAHVEHSSELVRLIDRELEALRQTLVSPDDKLRLAVANVFANSQRHATEGGQPAAPERARRALMEFIEVSLPRRDDPAREANLASHLFGQEFYGWSKGLRDGVAAEVASLPLDMPVLAKTKSEFGKGTSFSESSFVARTHLLRSTLGLVRELGVKPENGVLCGKEYSSNTLVMDQMARQGFSVLDVETPVGRPGESGGSMLSRLAPMMDSAFNPTSRMEALVAEQLKSVRGGRTDALRVVDDGGEMILMLAEGHADLAKRISAVEQTRFGANKIRDKKIPFPVVNVAESPVKLHMESVLIGWSVASEVQKTIDALASQGLPAGKRVVLVGYGAVGQAVAKMMRLAGYSITVVDKVPEKNEAAEADGFATSESTKAMESADYVIGATGAVALTRDDVLHLKDGAVLFSASSSMVEFAVDGPFAPAPPQPFPEPHVRFQGRNVKVGTSTGPLHAHQLLLSTDKEFLVAKGSYPINLTGGMDPIAPNLIQLTRALLLLGVIQSKEAMGKQSGLLPLDRQGQRFIATEWMKEVRELNTMPTDVIQMLEAGYAAAMRELSAGED